MRGTGVGFIVASAALALFTLWDAPQVRADAINDTDFVIIVKTGNPGNSNPTQFTIPTFALDYNYSVGCNNDGAADVTSQTDSYTRNYPTTGTHAIRISDTFPRIYFNNTGDKLKLYRLINGVRLLGQTYHVPFAVRPIWTL